MTARELVPHLEAGCAAARALVTKSRQGAILYYSWGLRGGTLASEFAWRKGDLSAGALENYAPRLFDREVEDCLGHTAVETLHAGFSGGMIYAGRRFALWTLIGPTSSRPWDDLGVERVDLSDPILFGRAFSRPEYVKPAFLAAVGRRLARGQTIQVWWRPDETMTAHQRLTVSRFLVPAMAESGMPGEEMDQAFVGLVHARGLAHHVLRTPEGQPDAAVLFGIPREMQKSDGLLIQAVVRL